MIIIIIIILQLYAFHFFFFIGLYAFHGTSANTYAYIDNLSSVWESIVTNTFLYNISIIQNWFRVKLFFSNKKFDK